MRLWPAPPVIRPAVAQSKPDYLLPNNCCRTASRTSITYTATGATVSKINASAIVGNTANLQGCLQRFSYQGNPSDLQSSATPSAAKDCRVHFRYQQNASRLQPCAIPSVAGCRYAHNRQEDDIPTMHRADIQAQQNLRHQAALSGDIEHNCHHSPRLQLTSTSLLTALRRLVYKHPVGAAGFEPATSSLSGMRSDQLSYAPSVAYFTVRAAWASSGMTIGLLQL